MKIKRIVSTFLAVLLMMSFCGCQLAQKNMGEDSATAHIIGLIITTEYLDLFDAEAYLADHFAGISSGEFSFSENSDRYNGRYYATLQPITDPNGTGSQKTYYQYEFIGIEGMPFFSANHPDSVDMSDFLASCYDSAVSDIHTHIFISDSGERVELDGTIYLATTQTNKSLFLNPVYQTQDGSVYVESGDFFERGGVIDEGLFVTNTYSDTTTTTRNGVSETGGNTIQLSIAFLNPPEKIVVIQMDQNSKMVKSAEFAPGELPETLTPEPSTEYVVVETYKADSEGSSVVTRDLFSRDDETFFSFYARTDGICVKQWTTLEW